MVIDERANLHGVGRMERGAVDCGHVRHVCTDADDDLHAFLHRIGWNGFWKHDGHCVTERAGADADADRDAERHHPGWIIDAFVDNDERHLLRSERRLERCAQHQRHRVDRGAEHRQDV